MKLDRGMMGLPTVMGLILTVLLIVVFIGFAVIKFETLINRRDVEILSTVNQSVYDPDYIFKGSDGLNFAIGITAYDQEEESIIDPSIGELVVNAFEWGPQEDGSWVSGITRLGTHSCSKEELGLEGNKSKFMPIFEDGT